MTRMQTYMLDDNFTILVIRCADLALAVAHLSFTRDKFTFDDGMSVVGLPAAFLVDMDVGDVYCCLQYSACQVPHRALASRHAHGDIFSRSG
jgi:hypothetical protein